MAKAALLLNVLRNFTDTPHHPDINKKATTKIIYSKYTITIRSS